MKVKIIVGRNGLPSVGEVRYYEKSYALALIEKGLAEKAIDKKPEKSDNKQDKKHA